MNKKQLFHALQNRTSLRVVRRVLAQHGFPRAQGWDQIQEKLKDTLVEARADYPGLQNALRELLIVSAKGCRIYELDHPAMAKIRAIVTNFRVSSSSVFTTHFPFPVPENILASLPQQPAIPISKFNSSFVDGLLLSSIQVFETRETLTSAQIGAKAGNYDEVIGIKKIKKQTFDAVLVSKSKNYVYVLTDSFQDGSQSMQRALNKGVINAVNKLAGMKVLDTPVNLLSIVEPLYESNDGLVKSLQYTTTTASGKHEWMRGNGNCLRKETSHKAAMEATDGGFQAYGIHVEWPLDEVQGYTPNPSLGIYGTYGITYDINPAVNDSTILGCASIKEMEFVLSEMMLHISGSKSI